MTATPYLLSPSQLHDVISSGNVSILDATWFLPNTTPPRDPLQEFRAKRISGAQYLDLDKVASPNKFGLKHIMPSKEIFADACEKLGIHPDSHVVIYDTHGIFSSPRALFMFRAFGHQKSSILDGGLPRWEAEGFRTVGGPPPDVTKSTYPARPYDATVVRSFEQIIVNSFLDPASNPATELVVDARSRARFCGTEPEPRPGLPSGHIPHSLSLPFDKFLKTHETPVKYTTFLSIPDLKQALGNAIGTSETHSVLTGTRLITTTCGSGMTAAITWLGLKLLCVPKVALFDGGWAGYGVRCVEKCT